MCSFTLNPAFHHIRKIFSYNLALPLIYCWPIQGLRPFLVKILGLVCVVSHNSKIFSYNLALPLIYCWPALRPYRKHWQEISEFINARGFVYGPWAGLNLKAVCKHRPSSWCCNTEVKLGIQVSDVTYYAYLYILIYYTGFVSG